MARAVPGRKAQQSGSAPALTPGVRDRLLERLVAMGLPPEKRVSYVAGLTGRATQTVRRWFAPRQPGLPDLQSFARLCVELRCSADEVIGLSEATIGRAVAGDGLLVQVAECVHGMASLLRRRDRSGELRRVSGDEMEPRLRDGDMVFVPRGRNGFSSNGLYALQCKGRVIVRRVEQQVGRGWVLKCDNKAYADIVVESDAAAGRLGLRVLGKVRGAIGMRVY